MSCYYMAGITTGYAYRVTTSVGPLPADLPQLMPLGLPGREDMPFQPLNHYLVPVGNSSLP